jgi:hypothetical protein
LPFIETTPVKNLPVAENNTDFGEATKIQIFLKNRIKVGLTFSEKPGFC